METNFNEKVMCLYQSNNWKEILRLKTNNDKGAACDMLWVWPNEENLNFIAKVVQQFNMDGIISIGCGSGLLEWLLEQCTGVPVNGIEINNSWWTSKYAEHTFIPLQITDWPPKKFLLKNKCALLFCYFNNYKAFLEYLSIYNGNMIFIIGPGRGRGTHTNPAPFTVDFGCDDWELYDSQEIRNTRDFIAVYIKTST